MAETDRRDIAGPNHGRLSSIDDFLLFHLCWYTDTWLTSGSFGRLALTWLEFPCDREAATAARVILVLVLSTITLKIWAGFRALCPNLDLSISAAVSCAYCSKRLESWVNVDNDARDSDLLIVNSDIPDSRSDIYLPSSSSYLLDYFRRLCASCQPHAIAC